MDEEEVLPHHRRLVMRNEGAEAAGAPWAPLRLTGCARLDALVLATLVHPGRSPGAWLELGIQLMPQSLHDRGWSESAVSCVPWITGGRRQAPTDDAASLVQLVEKDLVDQLRLAVVDGARALTVR